MAREQTEGELVALARRGDGDAYASLVRAHSDIAFRTAMLITQDAAEAEEAAQDAFVKAWRALGRFREGEPWRPWLLTIVANEARNRRRSAGRRQALALRLVPHGRDRLGRGGRARGRDARDAARRAGAPARRRPARARLPLPARALRGRDGGRARREGRHGEVAHVARPRTPARGGDAVNDLEGALRELDVDWPATPDLTTAVRARIAAPRHALVATSVRPWRWPRARGRRRRHAGRLARGALDGARVARPEVREDRAHGAADRRGPRPRPGDRAARGHARAEGARRAGGLRHDAARRHARSSRSCTTGPPILVQVFKARATPFIQKTVGMGAQRSSASRTATGSRASHGFAYESASGGRVRAAAAGRQDPADRARRAADPRRGGHLEGARPRDRLASSIQ